MGNTTIPAELVAINAIQGTLIADNAITAVHIAQNQVHSVQLAINSVTATQIADGTITSVKIQDGTIATADIADVQITTAKLADNSVTSAKIVNASIVSADIANNAILTQHIDDNQITADQIADNAVGLGQMAGLTRGSIIYGDSAGNPAYLAVGTANKILTSDGTDISWSALNSGIDDNSDAVAITIDSSEKVGIGTTSPGYILETSDAGKTNHYSNRRITVRSTNNGENVGYRFDALASDGTARSGGYYFQPGTTDANTYLGLSADDSATVLAVTKEGNVGIGETLPDGKLHIKGGTATGDASHILFENTQGSKVFAIGGGSTGVTNNHLFFRNVTDNTRPMVITDAGNVGIGEPSPERELHVISSGQGVAAFESTAAGLVIQGDSTTTDQIEIVGYKQNSSSYHDVHIRADVDALFVKKTSGNIGIGEPNPDTTLHIKKNQSSAASSIKLENSAGGDDSSFDINWQLASSGTSAQIRAIRTNDDGAGDTDLVFSTSTNGTSLVEGVRIGHLGNLIVKSTHDQILTLNQDDTGGWNYIGFAKQNSRQYYMGINSGENFELGADSGTRSFNLVGFNSLDIASVTSTFKSGTYGILELKVDSDDNDTNSDGIIKITTGSSGTVKGEFRYDESEDKVHLAYGDHGRSITIDSSGKVGIGTGTAAQQRQLHVNSGATNVVARLESTDAIAAVEFKDNTGSAEVGCNGNSVVFYPGGNEKASINSSGLFTTNGNITATGTNATIDAAKRLTARVQDSINIGGDNWSYSNRYYAGFGYGTGASLGGHSVNMTNGQNSSWYSGLTFQGYVTWIPDVYIPYAIGQVYGLSATFFQHANNTAGTAVQYVGCIGYDSSFNFMNHDAIGTYQYNLSSSATFTAGATTELDVTLKGWQGSGQSDGNKMDRGTAYIRPMMLINYPWSSTSGGTTPSTTMMSFTMGPKHTVSDNDSNAGTNY